MAIIKRKPKNPVPVGYQPPNTKPYKVSTGESLASIADKFGMKDWKKLTELNWKTSDPAEVNWYLGERVGCTAPSPDGYNYSFRSGDLPGTVYVPIDTGPRPGSGRPGNPGPSPNPPPSPAGPSPGLPSRSASPVAAEDLNTLAQPAVRLPIGWWVRAPGAKTHFRLWVPTDTGGTLKVRHLNKGTVDLRKPSNQVLKAAAEEVVYDVPRGEYGTYDVIAKGKTDDKVECTFVQVSFSRDGPGDTDPALVPWNFYYWPTALEFQETTAGPRNPNPWSARAIAVVRRYAQAFGKDPTAAGDWEKTNHGHPLVGEGWEGHCHNSAPASMLFEQPIGKAHNGVSFDEEELEYLAAEYFGNFGQFGPDYWVLKRGNTKPGGQDARWYLPGYFKPGGPKTKAHFLAALKQEFPEPDYPPTVAGSIADGFVNDMGGEAAFGQQITEWLGELAAEFYENLIQFMRVKKHPLLSNMRSYAGSGGVHAVWNQAFFRYHAWYQENGDTRDDKDMIIHCRLWANEDDYPSTGLPAVMQPNDVEPIPDKSLLFKNVWRIQFDSGGKIRIQDKKNEWRSLQNDTNEQLYAPTNLLTLKRPGASRRAGRPFSLGNEYVGTDLVTQGLLTIRKRYQ